MARGWNEKRRPSLSSYGSEDLDASLLIMPLVFFMAPNDPRMLALSTLSASRSQGVCRATAWCIAITPAPDIDGSPGGRHLQHVLVLARGGNRARRADHPRKADPEPGCSLSACWDTPTIWDCIRANGAARRSLRQLSASVHAPGDDQRRRQSGQNPGRAGVTLLQRNGAFGGVIARAMTTCSRRPTLHG